MPRRRGTQRTYVATHGRVPGGRSGQTASTRAAGGRWKPARHLTHGSRKCQPGLRARAELGQGGGARGARPARSETPTGRRGLRPRAPPGSRGPGRIALRLPSAFRAASSAGLRLPHRPRLPPLPARELCDVADRPDSGIAGPSPFSARVRFSELRSLCLLLLHQSPTPQPPPVITPQANMAAAAAAARARAGDREHAPLPRAFLATTASPVLPSPLPRTPRSATVTTLEHHGKCSLRGGVGVGRTPKLP